MIPAPFPWLVIQNFGIVGFSRTAMQVQSAGLILTNRFQTVKALILQAFEAFLLHFCRKDEVACPSFLISDFLAWVKLCVKQNFEYCSFAGQTVRQRSIMQRLRWHSHAQLFCECLPTKKDR